MNRAPIHLSAAVTAASALWPCAALAELPDGVRAMIDAAIAGGDQTEVETVLALARSTYPDESAEIDRIAGEWEASRAEAEALAAKTEEEAIRSASLFERWSGKGEFGAFHSDGNSEAFGLTAGLNLDRKGLDWNHILRARADFQKTGGVTTREQFLLAYEPHYEIGDNLFAYGLAQFERDRLQGFSGRYAVSGGLGYKLLAGDDLTLAVKAGPAYRITDYTVGDSDNRIAGLAAFDFDWKIAENLSLTQDASMVAETGSRAAIIVDSSNTSINLVTGLDARVSDRVGTRLSYALDYDSNPPAGAVSTDTITRFSVVYDF